MEVVSEHTHKTSMGPIGPVVYYTDKDKSYHYHATAQGPSSIEMNTPHHKHLIPGGQGYSSVRELSHD